MKRFKIDGEIFRQGERVSVSKDNINFYIGTFAGYIKRHFRPICIVVGDYEDSFFAHMRGESVYYEIDMYHYIKKL